MAIAVGRGTPGKHRWSGYESKEAYEAAVRTSWERNRALAGMTTTPAAPTPTGGGDDYMSLYGQALEGLRTGGMTLEASLQEIEEGKQQAIARGQQSMVSGGLAGTTVMGGIPLQAEKIAATKRLGARGQAQQTYLTALASFSAFAQRAQEAKAERDAAMSRLQTQIKAQKTQTAAQEKAMQSATLQQLRAAGSARIAARKEAETAGTTTYQTVGGMPARAPFSPRGLTVSGPGGGATYSIPTSDVPISAMARGGGGYAPQFPAIYDQGGYSTPPPDWMTGGPEVSPAGEAGGWQGVSEPPTGSVPYGQRTAPTIAEPSPRATDVLGQWGY
jgi:hypothetical protein